jgi:hypothetical protein
LEVKRLCAAALLCAACAPIADSPRREMPNVPKVAVLAGHERALRIRVGRGVIASTRMVSAAARVTIAPRAGGAATTPGTTIDGVLVGLGEDDRAVIVERKDDRFSLARVAADGTRAPIGDVTPPASVTAPGDAASRDELVTAQLTGSPPTIVLGFGRALGERSWMVALDLDGKQLWERALAKNELTAIAASPARAELAVMLAPPSGSSELALLDARTGSARWRQPLDDRPSSSDALSFDARGRLFILFHSKLRLLAPADGATLGERTFYALNPSSLTARPDGAGVALYEHSTGSADGFWGGARPAWKLEWLPFPTGDAVELARYDSAPFPGLAFDGDRLLTAPF